MKLTTFHQVLMIAVAGLCALLAIHNLVRFATGGVAAELGFGLVAGAVCAGVVLYLRNFRRKLARPTSPADH